MRHVAVIVIFVVLTGVCALAAARLHVDTSFATIFPEDDPEYRFYRRFVRLFGGDELVAVGIECEDVFRPEVIEYVEALTERLRAVDGVMTVTSLTNAIRFASSNYRVEAVRLLERGDDGGLLLDDERLARARRRALSDPLVVNNIVSPDGRATAVVMRVRSHPNRTDFKPRLVSDVRAALKGAPEGIRHYLAGPPVLDVTLTGSVAHDILLYTPLVVGMLALLLFYVFRDIRGVVLPLMAVGAAVIWTCGLVWLASGAVTLATAAVPPIMLAVGVAIVTHLLSNYRELRDRTAEPQEAVRRAVRTVAMPCTMAALTTAVGFLSLGFVNVPAVRQMGLFCAFSVVAVLVVALVLVPAVLSLWCGHRRLRRHRGLERLLATVAHSGRRTRAALLVSLALLCAAAAWGVTRLRVQTSILEYFASDNPARVSTEFFSRNLGGVSTLDVLVTDRSDPKIGVLSVDVLERVDELQRWIAKQTNVAGKVISVLDVLRAMNEALLGVSEALPEPKKENLAEMRHTLRAIRGRGGVMSAILTEDLSTMRVSVRLKAVSSGALVRFRDGLEARVRRLFPFVGGASARVTGTSALLLGVARSLVAGQRTGLLIAFLAIFAMLLVTLRSLPISAAAMLVTGVPILICLGVMGIFRVPVNVSTSMIPSVAVGILVDNAVHYIWRCRHETRMGASPARAVRRTLATVGKPIAFTAAILSCGFGVLILSSFRTNLYLGLFIVIALWTGLFCTFLLLPVLLPRLLRPPASKHHAAEHEHSEAGRQQHRPAERTERDP